MSRRASPKLDLELNLSPPRANNHRVESPTRSPTSPVSSCVSSEVNQDDNNRLHFSDNSEESTTTTTDMFLFGCPRCHMYVMLAVEPRCPQCKGTILLDVLPEDAVAVAVADIKAKKG